MIGLDECHRRRGQDGRAGPQPITGVSPARQKTPAVSPGGRAGGPGAWPTSSPPGPVWGDLEPSAVLNRHTTAWRTVAVSPAWCQV
jgi:hypothetical protein